MEDIMIIEKEGKEIEIYPLLEVEKEEKHFLIYTNTKEIKEIEDNLYVAELIENELCPIKKELLENFEQLMEEIMKKIREKLENNNQGE